MKGLLTKDFLTVKKKYGIARLMGLSQILCKHRNAVQNRAKII